MAQFAGLAFLIWNSKPWQCCHARWVDVLYFCGWNITEIRIAFRWFSNHRNTCEELTSLCNWKKWWVEILNEMMTCRAASHVKMFQLRGISIQLCIPKRRRGSLQTCLNFDILWYVLKFFSVIKYWIPIKVLGLRFADLVLCPAFALQGLFCILKLHKRTDGLELGIWKISGDLGWTSVLISDIQWLCGWISGDWPWLAHGNHIPYHGNGSDPTGLRTIFNSRVWKLWTTVSEKVRPVGQDDLCNTYKLWMHDICVSYVYHDIIWHIYTHITYRYTYCAILRLIYICNYIFTSALWLFITDKWLDDVTLDVKSQTASNTHVV